MNIRNECVEWVLTHQFVGWALAHHNGRHYMRKRNWGVTLLECLVFSAVMAIVSGFAMRAIGQGRMIRSNARDRLTMLAIAQSELDRARMEANAPGVTERSEENWPSGTVAKTTVASGPGRTRQIFVSVTRESFEGKPEVRLATLIASSPAMSTPSTSSTASTQSTQSTQPGAER